jgi:hypothetical protein
MEKEKMLTTQQVAERLNRPYPTIALWVRQGRFKNAVAEETPRGRVWWVPESDLAELAKPKPGRPPNTEVGFYELLDRVFRELAEEFNVSFEKYSFPKYQNKGYERGDWTWDYDGSLRVQIRLWRDSFGPFPDEEISGEGLVDGSFSEDDFKDTAKKAIKRLLKNLASKVHDASPAIEADAPAKQAKKTAGKRASKKGGDQ